MNKREVIGEGTYGCAHYPSLICKGDVLSPSDKISKLMSSIDATTEMKEYVVIAGIDPENEFYLGQPKMCNLGNNSDNINAIKRCKIKDKVLKNVELYSLLIMKNGGLDLNKFAKTLKVLTNTTINRMKMELFWVEVHRLLRGLKVFIENDLVHHDTKGGNIVYNETENRLNFIDFGLMTSKNKIKSSCIDSTNLLSIFHWSFPLELGFDNRNAYYTFARKSKEEKTQFVQSLLTDIQKPKPELILSNAIKVFYSQIIPNNKSNAPSNVPTFDTILTDFSVTVIEQIIPGDDKYLDFLEKSINTIDSYGVGIGLMVVLCNSAHLIDGKLANELNDLFYHMFHPNVFMRYSIDEILKSYEEILYKFGLLSKIGKHFVDHKLVKGNNIPKQISDKLKKITDKQIKITEVELTKQAISPIKQCSKGSEYNTSTRRCVKKTKKTKTRKTSPKKCPISKELNPKTNRCVNVCKSGYKRDKDFKCVKLTKTSPKKCPISKELNPKTNRCVNVCKSGYKRDKDFKCKKYIIL